MWFPGTHPPHKRDYTLTTHETRDDFSPPVSCTHLLTVWLVSAASAVSQCGELFPPLGRSHEPSGRFSFAKKLVPHAQTVFEPCRSDELRSLCRSRMRADHTCAHTNSRTFTALFGAAQTNSAPEARTSGGFSRLRRTLLGSLPVIF